MLTRIFLRKLMAFILPIAVVAGLPALVAVKSGEIYSPDAIARRHMHSPDTAVYGPAYTNPDKRYKLVSIRLHQPNIFALGSSRVMQFRASFFSRPQDFYNGGSLVTSAWHITHLVPLLPRKVGLVLLGLDQWWFNPHWSSSGDDLGVEMEYSANYDVLNQLQHSLAIWRDLASGKLPLQRVLATTDNIGVNAIVHGDGFRKDGSYAYNDRLLHPETQPDWRFADSLARIAEGSRKFEYSEVVDDQAITALIGGVRALRAAGYEVAAFLPPFAPTVLAAMRRSERYGYIERLALALRAPLLAESVPFFDFSDCAALGCADEEFFDGFHGGERTYARIALSIATVVPTVQLNAALPLRLARGSNPALDE